MYKNMTFIFGIRDFWDTLCSDAQWQYSHMYFNMEVIRHKSAHIDETRCADVKFTEAMVRMIRPRGFGFQGPISDAANWS
jgi:hypothetical protein